MGELIHLSHLGFLGVSKLQEQLRQGQKCYAKLDLSQSIQEVPCVENKLFLVLVWELHALERSVFDGFERDEGGKERKSCLGRCITPKGLQLKAGGQGDLGLDHTAAFPSLQDIVPCGETVDRK